MLASTADINKTLIGSRKAFSAFPLTSQAYEIAAGTYRRVYFHYFPTLFINSQRHISVLHGFESVLNCCWRQLQICKASFALKEDVFYTVIYSLYYCRVILQKLAGTQLLNKYPGLYRA
jgi:hypothetical protein